MPDVSVSLKPSKDFIGSIITHLQLKGKVFKVFDSVSDAELNLFFQVLLQIDSLPTRKYNS